jgi:hypothetical protein
LKRIFKNRFMTNLTLEFLQGPAKAKGSSTAQPAKAGIYGNQA